MFMVTQIKIEKMELTHFFRTVSCIYRND